MVRLSVSESLALFGKWLRKILLVNLSFLFVMMGFRFCALLLYGQSSTWTVELIKSFWMGFRFDGVVLAYFLVLPSLFLVLALHMRRERVYGFFGRFLRPYYTLIFFLVAVLLALDTQYYSYFQDHFNILVFGLIEDDTLALLATFWKNYPVLWYFSFALAGLWLLYRWLAKALQPPPRPRLNSSRNFLWMPLASLALLVMVFAAGRGSFGLFPLGQTDTVVSRDPFLNHLSSNGIYSLYRATKLRRQQNLDWDNNLKYYGYSSPQQAFADFYQLPVEKVSDPLLGLFHQKTSKNLWAEKNQPHVIVFMMESFGGYWLQFHSKDFNLLGALQPHLKQDIYLKNFLPSASSTTGSLGSIMVSVPQRPIGNFLTESQYLQVPFRSSPARIFSRNGYETHFIYGGNPGWRDMNKFARYQGFEHVEGEVDMQAKLGNFKETHDWGVYDEDVLRYVMTLLKEAKKPQMILVMTTTNHPPYQLPSTFHPPAQKIPSALEGRLIGDRKIIEARFRTYLYSNEKLGEFMNELKASPLGEKTIVSATGDHGFLLINFNDEELLQKWSVPFYLYTPKALKVSLDPETFGSHMDIFPTLMNLAFSEKEFDALGVNLLDPHQPHFALHSSQLILGTSGGAQLNGQKPGTYYQWQGDFEKLVPAAETAERKAMATRYKALMSLLDYYFMAEKKAEKK